MKFIQWLKKIFDICEHEWESYNPHLKYSIDWKMKTCKKCGKKELVIESKD